MKSVEMIKFTIFGFFTLHDFLHHCNKLFWILPKSLDAYLAAFGMNCRADAFAFVVVVVAVAVVAAVDACSCIRRVARETVVVRNSWSDGQSTDPVG